MRFYITIPNCAIIKSQLMTKQIFISNVFPEFVLYFLMAINKMYTITEFSPKICFNFIYNIF